MVDFDKVPRITATMQVVNSIRDALASGSLKVGDRLPPEADMAKAIGVGRSSFREGMRILSAYGVVEIRQGEGTYIINRMAEHFLNFIGFLPTDENLLYMLDLRRVVEVGNIMNIYNKLTEEQIQELEQANEKLFEERSIEWSIQQDVKFHGLLISYSENPLLIQINEMIARMRAELLRKLFQRPGAAAGAAEAHMKIIQGLRRHDLAMCVQAISDHLEVTAKDTKTIQEAQVNLEESVQAG